MPVHDDMLLADLQTPFNHKIHDLRKMLFCRRDLPGIDVLAFKGCKIQFAWSDIVRMRALQCYWNSQLFEQCVSAGCSVVTGSIHGDHGILPPVRPFFVKFEHKLLDVKRKHMLI